MSEASGNGDGASAADETTSLTWPTRSIAVRSAEERAAFILHALGVGGGSIDAMLDAGGPDGAPDGAQDESGASADHRQRGEQRRRDDRCAAPSRCAHACTPRATPASRHTISQTAAAASTMATVRRCRSSGAAGAAPRTRADDIHA